MRAAAAVALGANAISHLGRSPAVAAAALLSAVAVGIFPNRWAAGLACGASLMLAQGTEGWPCPFLAAMFLVSPRKPRRWFRIAVTGAIIVLWGSALASGIGVSSFWRSAGWGGGAAFIVLHLLLLDPAWIPGAASGVIEPLFYDGHCGLCHHAVKFLLAEDADGSRFRFAPLDSDAFRNSVPEEIRQGLPDSVVLLSNGSPLVRSQAALHALTRLGGLWRISAALARAIIPRPLADWTYDRIAEIRHRVFGRPTDVCPMMPPELRQRFIMNSK